MLILIKSCVPDPTEVLAYRAKQNLQFKLLSITNATLLDYFDPEIIKICLIKVYDDMNTIILISGIALVLAITLVFLLRYIAKVMVITVLVSVAVGFLGENFFNN